MFSLQRRSGSRRAARRFTAAFTLGAFGLCGFSTLNAYAQTGWVRQYTGQQAPPGVRPLGTPACEGGYCPFWEPVDRNAYTARLAASGGHLYQLQSSGAIYQYPEIPCTSQCYGPGWWLRDFDPSTKAIYADGDILYKLSRDGSVSKSSTGTAWSEVKSPDSGRLSIAVRSGKMASLYADGSIDVDSQGKLPTVDPSNQIVLDDHGDLYRLANVHLTLPPSVSVDLFYVQLLRSGETDWRLLDYLGGERVAISAGAWGKLYQLHNDGTIWRWKGTVCEGPSYCPGWEPLDNNPGTVKILAAGNELYQLHGDGSVWRYTGVPCNGDSCLGWEVLIADGVGQIAADSNRLYVLSQEAGFRPNGARICSECL